MKSVIYHSLDSNRETSAATEFSALSTEHIRISKSKCRNTGTIALDVLFDYPPKVNPFVDNVEDEDSDLVSFVGPVWIGQVASTLRACFGRLEGRLDRYAFVTICGGADDPNPKLGAELTKPVGRGPAAVTYLHIANLMPSDPKPVRKGASSYRLTEGDVITVSDWDPT